MVVVDSIIETIAESLDDEVESKIIKIILSIIFVLFYLFLVIGIMSVGFGFIENSFILGGTFILIGFILFIYFLVKFIIVYCKKSNGKLAKLSKILRLFKIEKK